jgi:PAS domain S-box-containing protein
MSDAIKILVIDDNKEFVTGLRLLLAKDNCSFYEAYNGPDGIKTASEVQPDLILLDVVMPGIDGYETLRRIKSNPLTSDSFVVMLSGIRTSTEDQAHGLETGSDGYITRPVSNRELLARIRTFIRLKKSEKNLSQSEEKYRMLFKNLILGYAHHKIISDDNGSPIDYVILEVNPEFEKLTGLKASEITGKSVMEIFPETEPYWIENYGEVAIKGTEMRFVEYSSVLNKYFEVFAFSSEPGFFSTLFYDVTDRHKNEELIKGYNTELQKNNLAKDKLFSIISHDIKGPFGAFVGLLEVLEEDIDSMPPAELKSVIAGMRHSAGNLQNLLENLLHWSRLQMDKLSFEPRVLRLKEIAGNCLDPTLEKPISSKKTSFFNRLNISADCNL